MKEKLTELMPIYDSRKSFYHKANYSEKNGTMYLYSYNTLVACITPSRDICIAKDVDKDLLFSNTTTRHLKEFFRQFADKVLTTKQLKELGGF